MKGAEELPHNVWCCKNLSSIFDIANIRKTRQRLVLLQCILDGRNRHFTAADIVRDLASHEVHVSPATIYNTLNRLSDLRLLKQIGIDGSRTFFDTNLALHHHFYVEDEQRLIDIPPQVIHSIEIPNALSSYQKSEISVVIRIRRRATFIDHVKASAFKR